MSKRKSKYRLTLHNDDTTSFQHVIECLIHICNHNYYQAGQCATIVHNAGNCVIYETDQEEAEEVLDLLTDQGLIVTMEKKKRGQK